MYLGKIVEIGPAEDVCAAPVHPYTEALLSRCRSRTPTWRAPRADRARGRRAEPGLDPPSGCRFHTRCRYATEVCRTTEPPLVPHRDGHRGRLPPPAERLTASFCGSRAFGQVCNAQLALPYSSARSRLPRSRLPPPRRPRRGRPPPTPPIHPGVQTFTDGAQCTANFVFTDASNVYIGQAAHCSGTGGSTETNGCDVGLAADRHAGRGRRRRQPGTLVYNSWLTMQARRDRRRHVRVQRPRAGQARSGRRRQGQPVDPALGRPDRGRRHDRAARQRLLVRQLELRGGITQLSPKEGVSLGDAGGGWTHTVYTRHPGHPRRLGQRVPVHDRRGARRAQHGRDRAARRLERRRRRRQELSYLHAHTRSAA